MPAYMFTYHGYRTWRPDHPKGYTRRDEGVLPPDPHMARYYDHDARQPIAYFTEARRSVLVAGARDIARRRDWRLHQVMAVPTHLHVLVSWKGGESPEKVRDTFKRLLGMMLSQHEGVRDRQWFTRRSSKKQVQDQTHFDYLMNDYLPRHGGRSWREDAAQA